MNPYSHIVLASKLEAFVNPENVQEYYWGAIAPDIRYLAALQRQQTHISSQRIVRFIVQYPHLKSFLQGYLVHCLSDEIELGHVFFQHFPFSILKNKMSRQQIAVFLEFFYFENEGVNKRLSGTYNEVLSELGLSEAVSTKFSQSVSQYAISSSPKSRLSDLFQLTGLENDSRIDKYMSAAKSFQKNWFLKNALFFEIRTGEISEQIVSMVASLYQQCGV
jgi:hypothetical protein